MASSEGNEISEHTASRDLRLLVDTGLLIPTGERRGRIYTASPEVRAAQAAIRSRRPARDVDDPFAIVASRSQPQLPLG